MDHLEYIFGQSMTWLNLQWPQDSTQKSVQNVDCSSIMKNFGTPPLCKKRAPTPESCPCVLENLACWLRCIVFFFFFK